MDVPYFKALLEKETEKLICLCEEWEGKLANSFTSTTHIVGKNNGKFYT